jgi:hypothetical protein
MFARTIGFRRHDVQPEDARIFSMRHFERLIQHVPSKFIAVYGDQQVVCNAAFAIGRRLCAFI